MALLRKFSGPVRITFKKVSLALSRYFIGVLKPSSGSYYLQGVGSESVATSDGMFLVGGDTSAGRFQKIGYDGNIGFQNYITTYVNTPGDGSQYLQTINVTSSGNLYGGGYFAGPAGNGCWITKYSSTGSLTWSIPILYLAYDIAGVTSDSSENVYFVGKKATGTFDSSNRLVLGSLNSSGNTIRWQTHYGTSAGTQSVIGYAISTYSTSVYATGIFYNSSYVQRGSFVKVSQSSGALELEQYYSNGSRFTSLVQNSSGDCYIGGSVNSPSAAILILKTNSSGTKQWATTLTNNDDTAKIAIDSSNNVYALCRSASNSLNISKYDSSGTIQWQRNLTFPYDLTGNDTISVNNNNEIFIATGARDTGLTRYYPFVALLKSDGSGTGTYTLEGQSYTYAASSKTVSTDSGSFTSSSLSTTDQSRSIGSITTDSTTDNLTLLKTSV